VTAVSGSATAVTASPSRLTVDPVQYRQNTLAVAERDRNGFPGSLKPAPPSEFR